MKRLGGRGDTPYLAVKGAQEGIPTISAALEIGRAHYRAKVAKRPYHPRRSEISRIQVQRNQGV